MTDTTENASKNKPKIGVVNPTDALRLHISIHGRRPARPTRPKNPKHFGKFKKAMNDQRNWDATLKASCPSLAKGLDNNVFRLSEDGQQLVPNY